MRKTYKKRREHKKSRRHNKRRTLRGGVPFIEALEKKRKHLNEIYGTPSEYIIERRNAHKLMSNEDNYRAKVKRNEERRMQRLKNVNARSNIYTGIGQQTYY